MKAPRRMLAAALVIGAALLGACTGTSTVEPPAPAGASAGLPTTGVPETAAPGRVRAEPGTSGLPTVALSSLPPQAQQTYDVILAGGPHPYRQDGQIFGNRERLLPWADYGWYREYTVTTPGSPDRGARRFVVGEDRTFFYTDDHYDSFREVVP